MFPYMFMDMFGGCIRKASLDISMDKCINVCNHYVPMDDSMGTSMKMLMSLLMCVAREIVFVYSLPL